MPPAEEGVAKPLPSCFLSPAGNNETSVIVSTGTISTLQTEQHQEEPVANDKNLGLRKDLLMDASSEVYVSNADMDGYFKNEPHVVDDDVARETDDAKDNLQPSYVTLTTVPSIGSSPYLPYKYLNRINEMIASISLC